MNFQFLIVEKDHNLRRQLKSYLSSAIPFVCISEATNGEEAFKQIFKKTPDIILMDIKLSGENGLKLTEKIKSNYPQTVVVINTGCDSPEYWQAASMIGADYFLSKNRNNIDELVSLIQTICKQLRGDKIVSKYNWSKV